MTSYTWRQRTLSRPIFQWARQAMPSLSATEREALEAGDAWWDAELFTGRPHWQQLLDLPSAELTQEERDFLEGPCEALCRMIDDWRIEWEWCDLPPEVWAFMRKERFFGMIIPKRYGGLGFSAYAHSTVVKRLSTRNIALAVTVMVPNSLGPGELLVQHGTEAQQSYWLPRLADGRELPCFALTSPEAGSDAASMTDTGVVCYGEHEGKRVLGIRLNWRKRYITLGPVATVMGLAFKLYDPQRLLGGEESLGITVALIPTDTQGVTIGRRHLPCMQPFQNGPNEGHDVFAPMEWVIGGDAQIGKGWRLLMSALAAGRGISLPSLSTAGAVYSAWATGAYSRVREQFGIPIGRFEGVQMRLARLAGIAYKLEAARTLTCIGLDQGHKPAVVSAIMKAHATYDLRTAVNDGMDVLAGKAVIDGPNNLLGTLYRAVPVAITVEGANILTRNLIIFGQGAIRCHPFLLEEIAALESDDPNALREFDRVFWKHVKHLLQTTCRAWLGVISGGRLSTAPGNTRVKDLYRQASAYSARFALLSDVALLVLGGSLKRRELLSARLGDVLSELYFVSAMLKRFSDDGEPEWDEPILRYCLAEAFAAMEQQLAAVLRNFPNRPVAWLVRLVIQPLGAHRWGASDDQVRNVAELLMTDNPARERLTDGIFAGDHKTPVNRLREAFRLTLATADVEQRLRQAGVPDLDTAQAEGILTTQERKAVEAARAAVAAIVAVDDFTAEELARSG